MHFQGTQVQTIQLGAQQATVLVMVQNVTIAKHLDINGEIVVGERYGM